MLIMLTRSHYKLRCRLSLKEALVLIK